MKINLHTCCIIIDSAPLPFPDSERFPNSLIDPQGLGCVNFLLSILPLLSPTHSCNMQTLGVLVCSRHILCYWQDQFSVPSSMFLGPLSSYHQMHKARDPG